MIPVYTYDKQKLLELVYQRAYKMRLTQVEREVFIAGARYVMKHLPKE